MSLRGEPVVEQTTLPDGRAVAVRVSVATDAYIPRRDLTTVALELVVDGRVEATVNTILSPSQSNEARKLAQDVAAKLGSGELAPTASAIERLADSML